MGRDLGGVLARIRTRIPDATPRELAELLWLSAQLGPPARDPPPEDTPPPSDILLQPPAQDPRSTRDRKNAAVSIGDAEKDHAAAQPAASSPASPPARRLRGRLAPPAALTELLSWSRALHRLGTLAAAGPLEVDRLATVQLAAKLGELHLVRHPRDLPVTWLAIVEDSAGQLAPWQRPNAALAALARRSGRFARVCHLRVDLSDPQTATLAASDAPPTNPGAHAKDPATALHHALAGAGQPGQPLLVLIITDGLAPGLRSGALTRALTHLPTAASVAWMHPWGESRWSASPLLATLARGRPRPLQPHDRRPLRPALIPWSPSGLAALEAWAAGRTTADLPGVHFPTPRPRHAQPRRSPPSAASPPSDIDWDDRGRKLACSLEPGTQQLLALAAGVPGAVNLDLLQAFAERTSERRALTTVPISRFNFAEALASGLLERDKTRPGLVVRFRDDDKPGAPARSVALRWLDTQQAADLLQFLAARLTAGDPRSDGLGIPYTLLLHILDPEANALDADLDLTPAQRGSLRSVIALARLDIPATTRAALEGSRPPPVSRPNTPSEDRIHTLVVPWLKHNIESLAEDLQPDLEALPLRVGQPPTKVTDLEVVGIIVDHEALDQPLHMGPEKGFDSTASVTFTRNAGITLRKQGDRLHAGALLWGTARLRGRFSDPLPGEDTPSASPRYRAVFPIEWRASFDLDITMEPASCTLRGHTNLSVSPYHFTFDELDSIEDIESDEDRQPLEEPTDLAPLEPEPEQRPEPASGMAPIVFVSYSRDRAALAEETRDLVHRLQERGMEVVFDQFLPTTAPEVGWPDWVQSESQRADLILCICSPSYAETFETGETRWEHMLAQGIFQDEDQDHKAAVILFGEEPDSSVPDRLQDAPMFRLPEGFEDLCHHAFTHVGLVSTDDRPAPGETDLDAELRARRKRARAALAELLSRLFSPTEVVRLLASLPNGHLLTCSLPDPQQSALIHVLAADLLGRHGLADRDLFFLLKSERPRRAAAIEYVANIWDETLPPPPLETEDSSHDEDPDSARGQLAALLFDLLAADELHVFLYTLGIKPYLRVSDATYQQYRSIVDTLERLGLIDRQFFHQLMVQRRHRAQDIDTYVDRWARLYPRRLDPARAIDRNLGDARHALFTFIIERLHDRELRALLPPDDLPAQGSMLALALTALEHWERRGEIGETLFHQLTELRPKLREEIAAIARMWATLPDRG